MSEELDRRSLIEAAMEQAEEGSLEAPEEKEIEVVEDDISEESAQEKARNEKGQFTHKEEQQEREDDELNVATQQEDTEEQVAYKRPTTWKKEYVEVWDKMEKGEQINRG